ncbi:MAG: Bug family tripartite tricarboxylate transporter substrate binding protein [Lautropia sp.]
MVRSTAGGMISGRRRALTALGAALALGAAAPAPAQEAYPSRPIRLVVPFGPGGLADITMRAVGKKLGDRLGQPIVVENKPGAGGVVAATAVLNAAPDGYTLIVFSNGTTIGKSLIKLPYDLDRDFVPISSVAYFDLILLARPDGPVSSVQTLLAEGRKRQLTFATITPGSTQNLSAELFKSSAGVDAVVVPYKTSPDVLGAVVRGEVDVGFESYAALKGPVDSGLVKVIASTGQARSPSLPSVPTVTEAGVAGYEVSGWNALYARAGTPPSAIARINEHLAAVLAMPDIQRQLRSLGTEGKHLSPAGMDALFKRDTEKWANVIRKAGIKAQ